MSESCCIDGLTDGQNCCIIVWSSQSHCSIDVWVVVGQSCAQSDSLGHFLQVFGTVDNLRSCVSLRLRYMLAILKETLPKRAVADVPAERQQIILSLVGLDSNESQSEFESLVIFDLIQFARSWAREWSQLLLKVRSVAHAAQLIRAMSNDKSDAGAGVSQSADSATKAQESKIQSRLTERAFQAVGGSLPSAKAAKEGR